MPSSRHRMELHPNVRFILNDLTGNVVWHCVLRMDCDRNYNDRLNFKHKFQIIDIVAVEQGDSWKVRNSYNAQLERSKLQKVAYSYFRQRH